MPTLLALCSLVALTTGFWVANIFVWLFVGLGVVVALSLGLYQRRMPLAGMLTSACYIASGFLALHSTIAGMAGIDGIALEPQVTTFAAPIILVLAAALTFCIALVEHQAQQATSPADEAFTSKQKVALRRRSL